MSHLSLSFIQIPDHFPPFFSQTLSDTCDHSRPFTPQRLQPHSWLYFDLGKSTDGCYLLTTFTCSGKEVRNEWKRISILFGDFIKASVVYAEVESFVLLESKDYLRAKITRVPWGEELWQINLVQRWSSRKLWRTLSSVGRWDTSEQSVEKFLLLN